jgi:hypothetical protein
MTRIFRAALFVLLASLAVYGATTIPTSAYETGEEVLTAALILTVNSLS